MEEAAPDWFVLEVSSFQLEGLGEHRRSPEVAIVLRIIGGQSISPRMAASLGEVGGVPGVPDERRVGVVLHVRADAGQVHLGGDAERGREGPRPLARPGRPAGGGPPRKNSRRAAAGR